MTASKLMTIIQLAVFIFCIVCLIVSNERPAAVGLAAWLGLQIGITAMAEAMGRNKK